MSTLLLLGLLVREVFSFWTGHPSDFELWVRLGYAMVHGGDPYGTLSPVPGLSFASVFSDINAPTIAYLPFWPLVTGLIYLVYSLIGVNDRFIYYFLLKQPSIFGDVSLAYLLYSYVSSRKPGSAGFWMLSIWLFSPFTIILSGIWGMFDSIAICFLIVSVSSIGQVRRALWTGLAIFAKTVPIIFAAPITMKSLKSLKDASGFVLALGLSAVLSGVTFIIMGWPFSTVSTTLVSTAGKGGWSMSLWTVLPYLNYLGVLAPIPANVYGTLGLVWIPVMVIFTCIAIRRFRTETDAGLFQALIVCTLVFLLFKAQVTEQYALYLFALGAVDVVLWNPHRRRLLIATIIVAMIYLVMNNYFLVRFLSPVYPNFVDFESTMNNLIGSVRYAMIVLTGTAFSILNIAYLADVLTRKKNDSGISRISSQ
ncbi:MAG TPA: hypothetical protein VJZ32_04440 [Candidatus Bathyarchaeia archaeon]|nr:hypothetical protein [Candidatus Bathyarchaeia archaeon]